jgi:hypothetical protein
MTDETNPGATDTPPAADTAADTTGAATAPAAALASASAAQATALWSKLGPVGQMIVGGAIASIVIALVGAVINAWEDSGSLVGVVVVAAVAAGAAAWFTARKGADTAQPAIPFETIEFAAGLVATILAVLRVIEMLFDLDDLEDYGGAIGAVLTVGLVVAAAAILVGSLRRDPSLRSALLGGDQWIRLAVGGLALVIIAWALNLSIGFWNMNAAATPVAVLTFGAVLVVVQPRWLAVLKEVPLGWVGAGFGVLGLLLAIGLWGELMDIGRSRVDLELIDYLPQALSFLGIIGIIAGGVMAGMPTWQVRMKASAPVTAVPPTTAPAAPAEPPREPAEPPASTEPPA